MYYKLNRDAVRALRNAKGLTQKGLAQKLSDEDVRKIVSIIDISVGGVAS